MRNLLLYVSLATAFAVNSEGAILTFENFAPVGLVANINPQMPYIEQGFTLTPVNANSAVFDAANGSKFPGDNTDWFGFASGNTITLTGPVPFNLENALIGPSTIGSGSTSLTVTGTDVNGIVQTRTFTNLTTATPASLGLANLTRATFSTASDAGLDDIVVTAVPEPRSQVQVILAGAMLVCVRSLWRRKPAV
jgi:hypothetical protein